MSNKLGLPFRCECGGIKWFVYKHDMMACCECGRQYHIAKKE